MKKINLLFALLTIVTINSSSRANNLELYGTLVEPPFCSISGGNTISVSFGNNVGVKKVSSGIYRQPIPISITCGSSNNLTWQLMLSVSGNPVTFDSDNATIRTIQQAALGVKLYQNGQVFKLNDAIQINAANLPTLEAVLVQQNGIELAEGFFSATATLHAEYL
ncbi:fimbrial protein [Citrobacter sp. Cb003]|uniref:fimbrial protein n=1 Tax=Citrobacter sp. Cb003 TaxID=2985005 RepID=UPI002579CD93|nr:fimbrial protein [Citrobacter sp. Cb003]MDM3379283.1 fimbrial protein [Citrobacter sp. Cb003]